MPARLNPLLHPSSTLVPLDLPPRLGSRGRIIVQAQIERLLGGGQRRRRTKLQHFPTPFYSPYNCTTLPPLLTDLPSPSATKTPPTTMTEKGSPDSAYLSHNEKNTTHQAELANPAGRRQSVALNIIENPLKVRFAIFASPPPSVVISSIDADHLHSHSAAPKRRPSSMPGLGPSRMTWLSTPLCSVGPLSSPVTPNTSRQLLRLKNKSAMRSSTRGTTNGTALSCFGIPSLCVPSEPPHKDGIRLDPTGPTCPSPRNLGLTAKGETNGSWESSMPSSS